MSQNGQVQTLTLHEAIADLLDTYDSIGFHKLQIAKLEAHAKERELQLKAVLKQQAVEQLELAKKTVNELQGAQQGGDVS